MQTVNKFEKTAPGQSTKTYKGIEVTKTWDPAWAGSEMFEATVNGKTFRSSYWPNLKKQIRKNLGE